MAHIAEVLEYEMCNAYDEFDNYSTVYSDMGVFWDVMPLGCLVPRVPRMLTDIAVEGRGRASLLQQWCSIYQKDPKLFVESEVFKFDVQGVPTYTPEFFGGQEYDSSRTLEQKMAFAFALNQTMDLWYAHQCTTVIFVTLMPDSFTGNKYDARGWVRARLPP